MTESILVFRCKDSDARHISIHTMRRDETMGRLYERRSIRRRARSAPWLRRTAVGCDWQPRPSKDGLFRSIREEFFENQYTRYTDAKGIVESW
jgi:hypothetical protein